MQARMAGTNGKILNLTQDRPDYATWHCHNFSFACSGSVGVGHYRRIYLLRDTWPLMFFKEKNNFLFFKVGTIILALFIIKLS
jgi:hypothetical protein